VASCDILRRQTYQMFGYGTQAKYVVDFSTQPPSLTAVAGTQSAALVTGAVPGGNPEPSAGPTLPAASLPPQRPDARKYVVTFTERSMVVEDLTSDWDAQAAAHAFQPVVAPPVGLPDPLTAPEAGQFSPRKRLRRVVHRPTRGNGLSALSAFANSKFDDASDTESPVAGEPAPIKHDRRMVTPLDALLYATLGSGVDTPPAPIAQTLAHADGMWHSDGDSKTSSASFDAGARQFLSDWAGCRGKDAANLLEALYQTALTSHSKYTAQVNLVAYHTSGKYVMRKWAMAAVREAIECRSLGRRMNRYYLRLPPSVLLKVPAGEDTKEFKSKGIGRSRGRRAESRGEQLDRGAVLRHPEGPE
jgi:hypothetical protein